MMAQKSDYQEFEFDADGHVTNPGPRMKAKLQAIPLPDLRGKRVLDVGCDFGFWTFLAANKGAKVAIGIDRNRPVRGWGQCDLISINRETAIKYTRLSNVCNFHHANIGKHWPLGFGDWDVIFMFSLYHHVFENCGDHNPIWFWLWTQCAPGGEVLWENPVDVSDSVAFRNISPDKHPLYNEEAILLAATKWFEAEYIGPALHEPNRKVYRFKPRAIVGEVFTGEINSGAGGATPAFNYAEGRRIAEIEEILDFKSFPGSLNVKLEKPFSWDSGYFRAQILDVIDRKAGLESEWGPRWARFYPVLIFGQEIAYIFRFEGEKYPGEFVELIAPKKLRDVVGNGTVMIAKRG